MEDLAVLMDLDGPILDVSERYYSLYLYLMTRYAARNILPGDVYWKLKQEKVAIPQILDMSDFPVEYRENYLRDRRSLIERREYLVKDKVHPFIEDALKGLSEYGISLVTLRNRRRNLLWQLKELKIDSYFTRVISADDNDGTWETKRDMVKRAGIGNAATGIFIGDSEADIRAAHDLNFVSIVVESGIRKRDFLMKYSPDVIIPHIGELTKIIENYV